MIVQLALACFVLSYGAAGENVGELGKAPPSGTPPPTPKTGSPPSATLTNSTVTLVSTVNVTEGTTKEPPLSSTEPAVTMTVRIPVTSLEESGSVTGWCAPELQCPTEKNTMCRFPSFRGRACVQFRNIQRSSSRKEITRLHNKLRRTISSGRLKGWPSAANMRIIRYNKTLEQMAYRWAQQCTGTKEPCRKAKEWDYVGQLTRIQITRTRQPYPDPEKDFRVWYDRKFSMSSSLVNKFHYNIDTAAFGQLVYSETDSIGCADIIDTINISGLKRYRRVYICNYGPGLSPNVTRLYRPGRPCSQCHDKSLCFCESSPRTNDSFEPGETGSHGLLLWPSTQLTTALVLLLLLRLPSCY